MVDSVVFLLRRVGCIMGIYNLTRAQLDALLASDGMVAASRAEALTALDAAGVFPIPLTSTVSVDEAVSPSTSAAQVVVATGTTEAFNAANPANLAVIATSGAGVTLTTTGNAIIAVTSAGNDFIRLNGAGADTLFSGEGADTIVGGSGNDIINSGGGNDLI